MPSRRSVTLLAATLGSAALFTLCFPPFGLRLLAWVALVPLLCALRLASFRGALGLAFTWSLAMSYGITDWLVPGITTYFQQSVAVGVAILLVATLLGATIDYLFFAVVYVGACRRTRIPPPIVAAVAWTAAELLRTRLGPGNPWGMLGYSQSGLGPAELDSLGDAVAGVFVQSASLGGVYAVSFVLVVVNGVIAEGVLRLMGATSRRAVARSAAVGAAVVAAAFAYGVHRQAVTDVEGDRQVGIVQGNLDSGSQWRPENYGANLETYLRLTRQLLTSSSTRPIELVVWPENAMTFFLDREPERRARIAEVLRPFGAMLVSGAPRFEVVGGDERSGADASGVGRGGGSGGGRDGDGDRDGGGDGDGDAANGAPGDGYDEHDEFVYYNSVFAVTPFGSLSGRYDKSRLLIFAEYFPFRTIELLRRSFGRVREFSSGERADLLATPIGSAGVLICNEAMYPSDARRRVRDGADFLINVSNDSWLANAEFSEHAYAMAAMRAVEHGMFLVRASTSGPSAIVGPDGRARVETELARAGVVSGSLQPRRASTLYAASGDTLAWLCLAFSIVFTGRALRNRKDRAAYVDAFRSVRLASTSVFRRSR